MDFEKLLHSPFFKNGQMRTTFDGRSVETVNSAFDTLLVESAPPQDFIWKGRNSRASGLYSKNKNGNEILGDNNPINLQHLHKVLSIGNGYIPDEFRTEICRQWSENNAALAKIREHSDAKIIASEIFMVTPGTNVGKHRHIFAPQTVTFGYRFDSIDDSSYLSVWDKSDQEHQYKLPLDRKFYFTFKDSADHGAQVNSWMFFWFYDFDRYVDIPDDIQYTRTI
jgi:hypothetical protein